jgi:hypothetical protein
MSAVAVAVMGGTALMGMEKQNHQQKIADSERMRRSAEQQYSPWTGIKDFTQVHDPENSALGAGLGGAINGAAFAQSLSKGFGGGGDDSIKGSVGDVNGQTVTPDGSPASASLDMAPEMPGKKLSPGSTLWDDSLFTNQNPLSVRARTS